MRNHGITQADGRGYVWFAPEGPGRRVIADVADATFIRASLLAEEEKVEVEAL